MYSKDSGRAEEHVVVEMLTHFRTFILQRQEGQPVEIANEKIPKKRGVAR